MIKPTVGRVVWFTPSATHEPGFVRNDVTAPLAAMVAHVWGDRMVNLVVFDGNGVPFGKTSVALLQDDDAKPSHGYFCEWMPYQVGQAKKHEGNAVSAGNSQADSETYLRRWAIETAMDAARNDHAEAKADVLGYAEKIRGWVKGEAVAK
jgi:hypothetical protein